MAKGYWILATGDVFSFDAVLIEQHAREMQITQHPLETGSVAADHVIVQPDRLSLEVAVSDVTLHATTDDPFALGVASSLTASGRAAIALDKLRKLQDSAEPFAVVTGMRLYPSMLIASLSSDETAQTRGLFRLELESATFVDTKTVTFPPRAKGKPARQAAPKTNNGQKDAPAVTDQQRQTSVLKALGASSDGVSSLIQKLAGINLQQPAP